MSNTKKCPKCLKYKSTKTGFHKCASNNDGLQYRCKDCQYIPTGTTKYKKRKPVTPKPVPVKKTLKHAQYVINKGLIAEFHRIIVKADNLQKSVTAIGNRLKLPKNYVDPDGYYYHVAADVLPKIQSIAEHKKMTEKQVIAKFIQFGLVTMKTSRVKLASMSREELAKQQDNPEVFVELNNSSEVQATL